MKMDPIEWVKTLGFPMAVALMLLAALMGWLPSPILQNIETQTKALNRHVVKDIHRDILLYQICRNTARNAGSDLDHCVRPWEEK